MRDAIRPEPFASSHSAMAFAYRHKQGAYPVNMLHKYQPRGPARGTPPPMGLDAAVLAGWVRMVVEGGNGFPGLPEPHRSIMLAKFSVDSALNLPAKLRVLEDVMATGTGLHKRRMVDLCVQRYFGGTTLCADGERRPIRQHQVADWCQVSQPTVSNAYKRVKAWLQEKEA
ncbi:MAG: hypothetical protein H7172_00345, partial [Ferruginibacter sp.]|nr:hypothetical protein [Rhodoferax sp.]